MLIIELIKKWKRLNELVGLKRKKWIALKMNEMTPRI